MALTSTLAKATLLKKLEKNAVRRNEAVLELNSARAELRKLILRGKDELEIPMTRMCERAGINRERAYELLRRVDVPKVREAYKGEED